MKRWTFQDLVEMVENAIATGIDVVPIWNDGALTLIGPLSGRERQGCACCAERWRRATLGPAVAQDPESMSGIGLIAPFHESIVERLAQLVQDSDEEGLLFALRGEDGGVSKHIVRPIGGCPQCTPLPADTMEAATIQFGPRPLSDQSVLRQDNPLASTERLRQELLDWRLGPVGHMYRSERSALSLVTAEIVTGAQKLREAGYGRARDFASSERVALFEAVERYSSARPRGRQTVVQASYAELGGERALDPETLGTHDPRYFADPRFFLTPYEPSLSTTWVHGYSCQRQQSILVPEHVAYWSTRHGPSNHRFVYESSNGCGLGNSLEEAVLYGLFEVAERDAFLMAWYGRTPLTEIAHDNVHTDVNSLGDRLESLGYDLRLFDITNDFGIPAVMSLALHRDVTSPAPQAFFAAGAHPDPIKAIHSAVAEVVTNVINAPVAAQFTPRQFDRTRLRPMLDQPELVLDLDDHVALNALPEARARFSWLTESGSAPRPWRELWASLEPTSDLTQALTDLIARLDAAGMDTVIVDQTEPWTGERLGLHTVKVIVPGSLPMTFRHVLHRTRGLPRLLDIPYQLGRVDSRLDYESLPLHPHPFP